MPIRASAPPLAELLPPLLRLCEAASDAIRRGYARAETEPLRKKADNSPLTEADLASHDILSEGLTKLVPGVPILSEESSEEAIGQRREWHELWVVDPLDGTREFLERSGEFTINVALVKDSRPVLGLIYEPLRRAGSGGVVGEGAWRFAYSDDGGKAGERGVWRSSPLSTKHLQGERVTLLSSRRHRNERLESTLDFLTRRFEVTRANSGSALKFSDLAAGRGDVYPRFSACSEWDVAAGDALVTAAGGAVWGLDGEPIVYNARDTLLSPHFLAVGDPSARLWTDLLDDLP